MTTDTGADGAAPAQAGPAKGATAAFAYVTTLFFAWGFATSLIDPLIAAAKRVFDLTTAEAFLTASAWFIAYGVVSLPAAAVLSRLGYSRSIIGALIIMVLGCLIVPAATAADWYPGVLIALFVIASGVTLLQVAANPLVAELGSRKGASSRLNLSQAFNSLGTTIGPWLGSHVLLTGGVFAAGAVVTAATRQESLRSIDFAFLGMGAFFALVDAFIFSARKAINASAPKTVGKAVSPLKALSSPWAIFGALAIFFYVGSEVSIGGMMTLFLESPDGLNVSIETAGKMVAWYWGGAMVGRFIGSFLMRFIPASAMLVFGIIGGAFLPWIAGRVADAAGSVSPAFIVPLLGYVALTVFAVACFRTRPTNTDTGGAVSGH